MKQTQTFLFLVAMLFVVVLFVIGRHLNPEAKSIAAFVIAGLMAVNLLLSLWRVSGWVAR